MPEYFTPGVYIEEIEIGSKPIEGASTSTAGFLGETERGPTTPRLVTSFLEFQRVFGGFFGVAKHLPHAVQGFFDNGGGALYIGRIVRSGSTDAATSASLDLSSGSSSALTADAVGEGAWGGRVAVKVAAGILSTTANPLFKLSVFYWGKLPDALFDPEADLKAVPRPDLIEVFDNLSVTAASPDYYEKRINGISSLIKLSKGSGSGAAPDTAQLVLTGEAQGADSGSPDTTIILDAEAPAASGTAYIGAAILITGGTGADATARKIVKYDNATRTATVDKAWTEAPDNTSEYQITVSTRLLTDGSDGAGSITLADYERTDTDKPNRKGLNGLAEIDGISIVYAPDATSVSGLAASLITHCELLKDRFAIIDASANTKSFSSDALNPRNNFETSYAAYYYPWIRVVDPATGLTRTVPPGGYAAGIYARVDSERGVFKAPANEAVRGATDLEFQITPSEQGILNPRGVNVIRAFPGRGILVWGARTLSSDTLWKYINVRRLFIYLEKSIYQGTQWVVFEPNDEKLWARVRGTVSEFLTRVWRDGALMGATAEQAFFVKADRSTMTQDDIDNGRLIVLIGVAPVKPAEFVIFRIAQYTGGSSS
jgi:phage tail sheath protein FI